MYTFIFRNYVLKYLGERLILSVIDQRERQVGRRENRGGWRERMFSSSSGLSPLEGGPVSFGQFDHSESNQGYPVPSHEIGNTCVYFQ